MGTRLLWDDHCHLSFYEIRQPKQNKQNKSSSDCTIWIVGPK